MKEKIKVIFWNLWGGKHSDKILSWLEKNKADIYCFQEVFRINLKDKEKYEGRGEDPHLFAKLSKIIDSPGYFSVCDIGRDYTSIAAHYGEVEDKKGTHKSLEYGLATFCTLPKVKFFEYEIHNSSEEKSGLDTRWMMQVLEIKISANKQITLANLRGLWHKDGKKDNVFRLKQSKKIIQFLSQHPGPYIIGGDLNLLPDTKSLKTLKNFNLRNLIEEFNIKTTRSTIRKKGLPWADYCLISKEIKVIDFKVPQTDASDHLPLILDFKS